MERMVKNSARLHSAVEREINSLLLGISAELFAAMRTLLIAAGKTENNVRSRRIVKSNSRQILNFFCDV